MGEVILEMKGIDKSFPGVHALDHVDLEIRKGEVLALMGENGAGKSTLMKVLTGIYTKDSGTITYEGKEVEFHSAREAQDNGVIIVHQELNMLGHLTVAQNIFIGREFKKGIKIDDKKMNEEAQKLFDRMNVDIDPRETMSKLTVGKQQMCEIAKAISHDAKIIIFDEPSAALTEAEIEQLFKIIRDLRSQGMGIVYISHRMDEIKVITDRVTVMRDGTYVGSWEVKDISDDEIVKQMVGRELTNVYPPKEDYRTDETVLKVEHLCSIHERSFQDCSFELKKGEILGFGGLVGAQRTEMMEAIFGMRHIASGTVEVLGKKVDIKKPEDAIDNSIGMITEDRRGTGILGCLSINDNTAIASYKNYTNAGVIDQKKVDAVVKDSIQKLNIKTPSGKTLIQSLSGGNQQKVIIARWLANNPDILIMDEPTRGIDVGAKYEIYQIMIDLVKQGKSIIMISSEMPELIGMSNRIIVMCNGRITGEVEGEEATQERIMSFATQFDLQGKSTTESKQED